MDEEEQEMLSEARARLANTKGKKAKRKVREKYMEEAKRLATLQKKRELKAAGIMLKEKNKRSGMIDYGSEVPLERRPAPGFYDTVEEIDQTRNIQKEFKPVSLDEIEGKKKKGTLEEVLVKQDIQKAKIAERANAPAALARAAAATEAAAPVRRGGKMMLPAPQISEAELEAIARTAGASSSRGGNSAALAAMAGATGNAATKGLLGDYPTPSRFATPMATPSTSAAAAATAPLAIAGQSQNNRIMQEAANLVRLREGQTPLLGGDNPDLAGSDFEGVVPSTSQRTHIPTPRGGGAGGVGATPSHHQQLQGQQQYPLPTPLRDAYQLNDPDAITGSARSSGMTMMRNDLKAGLSTLPAPQNEYQIIVPQMDGEDRGEAMDIDGIGGGIPEGFFEEDAADTNRRVDGIRAAREEEERKKRSQVLQRGLPRPPVAMMKESVEEGGGGGGGSVAQKLIDKEMLNLLKYEEAEFPIKDAKVVVMTTGSGNGSGSGGGMLESFELKDLEMASALLKEELNRVREEMGHKTISWVSDDEYNAAREVIMKGMVYVPRQGKYVLLDGGKGEMMDEDQLSAAQFEFEGARKEMEKESKRAAKLESKAGMLIGGLLARHGKLKEEAEQAWQQAESAEIELEAFKQLHAQEQNAAFVRMEELQDLVMAQLKKEKELQERYKVGLSQMRCGREEKSGERGDGRSAKRTF
jgi:pre-mRNA-splicing factor CDC5/CEF1